MNNTNQTDEKLRALENLGTGEFEHLNGSLLAHLRGTRKLLAQWGASVTLQDAGLYHAAYGTSGYSPNFMSLDNRARVCAIIGEDAEDIVYHYCACERERVFPLFGNGGPLRYHNRFNGESGTMSSDRWRAFCELTAANELEIARGDPAFVTRHGKALRDVFTGMRAYLSKSAQAAIADTLG